MSVKSWDNSVPVRHCQYYVHYDGKTGPVTQGPFTADEYIKLDRGSGMTTPSFNRRKGAGELLPYTPWQKLYYEASSVGSSSIDWTYNPSGTVLNYWNRTIQGNYPLGSFINDLNWVTAEANATGWETQGRDFLQECASKLASQGFDVATFAAESGKLADQFLGLGARLSNLVRRFTLSGLARGWLEYRYAWRTLYFDMAEFHDVLTRKSVEYQAILSEKAGRDFPVQRTISTPYHDPDSGVVGDLVITTSGQVSTRASMAMKLAAGRPDFQANFYVTAWELIPWSFVVDWFWSVGNAINALQIEGLSTSYTACNGKYIKLTQNGSTANVHIDPSLSAGGQFGSIREHTQSFQREYTLKARSPAQLSTVPKLQAKLDVPKIIDIAAFFL